MELSEEQSLIVMRDELIHQTTELLTATGTAQDLLDIKFIKQKSAIINDVSKVYQLLLDTYIAPKRDMFRPDFSGNGAVDFSGESKVNLWRD